MTSPVYSGWMADSLVVCGVDKVPLGEDQKLVMRIAAKFNSRLRQSRRRGA